MAAGGAGGRVIPPAIGRRSALARLGGGMLAAGAGGLLAGCAGAQAAMGPPGITIGFITPLTGAAARWGTADEWVVRTVLATPEFRRGFRAAGRTRRVSVQVRDSESDVNKAIALVHRYVLAGGVNLILAGGGLETAIPVAQVCETQGIPCLTTGVPWDLWYTGLGGDPAAPGVAPSYSALMFFGLAQQAGCFAPMWRRANAGPGVACLNPFDAVGNAYRARFGPMISHAGFRPVDSGAYPDGTGDFAAVLRRFRAAGGGPLTGTPLPADFGRFWRQAGPAGFRPDLVTLADLGQFPGDLAALGAAAGGFATAAWWAPPMPHRSSLTGQTAGDLAAAYQARTGRQWTQALGSSYSLFEIAREALRSVSEPRDAQEVAAAIRRVSYQGMCGAVDFTGGPAPGVAMIEPVGAQWRESAGDFRYELAIVDNTLNRLVPVGADLVRAAA